MSSVLRREELQDRRVHRDKCGISCIELTRVQGSYNRTIYIVRCERAIILAIRVDTNIRISFTFDYYQIQAT